MARKKKVTTNTIAYKPGTILFFDRADFKDHIVPGKLIEVNGVKGRVVYAGGEKIKFEVE